MAFLGLLEAWVLQYSNPVDTKNIINKQGWYDTRGPENLKKSKRKKLVKSTESISLKIFLPKSIFGNFKNGQKQIFELGKSLKVQKMQFHEFFF